MGVFIEKKKKKDGLKRISRLTLKGKISKKAKSKIKKPPHFAASMETLKAKFLVSCNVMHELWSQTVWVQISVLQASNYMTLVKLQL